jgi:serine/threonine protein phosphatase 1
MTPTASVESTPCDTAVIGRAWRSRRRRRPIGASIEEANLSVSFNPLSRLWTKPTRRIPTSGGRLVYAVGDIHGRADLLTRLVAKIERDAEGLASERRPVVVFLGDYVDRGDNSKSVIDQLLALKAEGRFEVRTLKGNHEQALMDFLDDPEVGPTWEDFGGRQTLLSYGVSPPGPRPLPEEWEEVRVEFNDALPNEHRAFLSALELMVGYGDYAFVHAGVRPGVPLAEQRAQDLLWIRDEFLRSRAEFDKVVVHGHSPSLEPFLGANRIGVDTGAYATGVLTAVRLHQADQTILSVSTRDL